MLSLPASHQDTLGCESGSGQKQLQGSVFPGCLEGYFPSFPALGLVKLGEKASSMAEHHHHSSVCRTMVMHQ